MYTEEEAKGKWCPFGRSMNGMNKPDPHSDYHTNCSASECMAWRFGYPQEYKHNDKTIHKEECEKNRPRKFNLELYDDDSICYYCGVKADEKTTEIPRRGYCGLAGKQKVFE